MKRIGKKSPEDCELYEIGSYIQAFCYDVEGNDSICNFCDYRFIKLKWVKKNNNK